MKWKVLSDLSQLEMLVNESATIPVLIFKHSTRCSISDAALSRLERNWNEDAEKAMKPYYLDLIAYRSISNEVAQRFGVEHQSPQVLIIKDGKCIYSASHFDIQLGSILVQLS